MKKRILAMVSVLILMLTIPAYAVQSRAPAVLPRACPFLERKLLVRC